MFKKILVVLLALVAVGGIGGTIYFYKLNADTTKANKILIQQTAELQAAIDAIGPTTTAYTVIDDMENGHVIKAEHLQNMTVPVASVNENTVTNPEDIVGELYKIDLQPGTTLTKDMVMSEEYSDTVYEQDLCFQFLPLGLSVGDYVDIRVTLPYGETFYVVTHKRIEQIVQTTNTIKVHMTAAQQMLWESAQKDLALYGQMGLKLYVTKYVEPGIQNDTLAFYPVRSEISPTVLMNPNITRKDECINESVRNTIDRALALVEQEAGSKFMSQASQEAAGITSAQNSYVENENVSDPTEGSGNESSLNDYDGYAIDFNQSADELSGTLDDLQEVSGEFSGSIEKTDADGNTSLVTDQDRTQAGGSNLFEGETAIE